MTGHHMTVSYSIMTVLRLAAIGNVLLYVCCNHVTILLRQSSHRARVGYIGEFSSLQLPHWIQMARCIFLKPPSIFSDRYLPWKDSEARNFRICQHLVGNWSLTWSTPPWRYSFPEVWSWLLAVWLKFSFIFSSLTWPLTIRDIKHCIKKTVMYLKTKTYSWLFLHPSCK